MRRWHSKINGLDEKTYAEIWWDTERRVQCGHELSLIFTLYHVSGVDMRSEEYCRILPYLAATKPLYWWHLHLVTRKDWEAAAKPQRDNTESCGDADEAEGPQR